MKAIIAGAAMSFGMASAHAQDARVETFQRVCIEARTNYSASATAAEAFGWTPLSDNAHPELQRVLTISRSFEFEDGSMSRLQAYGNVNHPSIFLALSEVTFQNHLVNGCYVYDFDAAQAVSNNVFEDLLGSPANEAIHQPGIISAQKWVGPEALPSVATLRVAFIPVGSEAGEMAGFDGVALAITSISSPASERNPQ